MGQQSLIYSFVARGTVILSEYTEFTGNFTSIASQFLQKLPSTNNNFTYTCDQHTFNYLVQDGFTFCVVAVESTGRQLPIAFLERIKEDFTKKYGGGKAATAVANSLNIEFGPKQKEQMQYCVDHPDENEISKLAKVKAQVSEVKGVILEFIEMVLDHGEKLGLLVDKTENLRSESLGATLFDASSILEHGIRDHAVDRFGDDTKTLSGTLDSMLVVLLKLMALCLWEKKMIEEAERPITTMPESTTEMPKPPTDDATTLAYQMHKMHLEGSGSI